MDEVRKKRAERAGRKLVERIEESNKKNRIAAPPPAYRPNYANPATPPVPVGRYGNAGITNNIPGATPENEDPYLRQQKIMKQNPNATFPAPSRPPKDDYYPPRPKNPNASVPLSSLPHSDDSSGVEKIFKNPNTITDSGLDLAFWDTKVYFYDEQGRLKPLPDGKYSMHNGSWVMVIRGGKQTIGNGDTTFWR